MTQPQKRIVLKFIIKPKNFKYIRSFDFSLKIRDVCRIVEADVELMANSPIVVTALTTKNHYTLHENVHISDIFTNGDVILVYVSDFLKEPDNRKAIPIVGKVNNEYEKDYIKSKKEVFPNIQKKKKDIILDETPKKKLDDKFKQDNINKLSKFKPNSNNNQLIFINKDQEAFRTEYIEESSSHANKKIKITDETEIKCESLEKQKNKPSRSTKTLEKNNQDEAENKLIRFKMVPFKREKEQQDDNDSIFI